jgi:hypothetical protein
MRDVSKFTTVKGSTVANVLKEVKRATASALVPMTGKPIKAVLSTLKVLHQQSKIHIADYEVNKQGQVSRVWAWGDGDDKLESSIKNKNAFVPRPDVSAAWMFNV